MRFTALLYLTALVGSLVSAQNGIFGFPNGMQNLASLFPKFKAPENPPSIKMTMPTFKDPLTAAQDLAKMIPGMPEVNPIKDASAGLTNAIKTLESMIPKFEGIKMPASLPSMEIAMPKMPDPVAAVKDLLKNLPNPATNLDALLKIPAELPSGQLTMPKLTDSLAAAQNMMKNVPGIQGMNPLKMLIDQGLLIPKEFMKDTGRRMSEGVESGKKFLKDGSDFLKLLKSFF